jgi:hypothetical protein
MPMGVAGRNELRPYVHMPQYIVNVHQFVSMNPEVPGRNELHPYVHIPYAAIHC